MRERFPPATTGTVPALAAFATAGLDQQRRQRDLRGGQHRPVRFGEHDPGISPLGGPKGDFREHNRHRRPGDAWEELGGRQLLGGELVDLGKTGLRHSHRRIDQRRSIHLLGHPARAGEVEVMQIQHLFQIKEQPLYLPPRAIAAHRLLGAEAGGIQDGGQEIQRLPARCVADLAHELWRRPLRRAHFHEALGEGGVPHLDAAQRLVVPKREATIPRAMNAS